MSSCQPSHFLSSTAHLPPSRVMWCCYFLIIDFEFRIYVGTLLLPPLLNDRNTILNQDEDFKRVCVLVLFSIRM